METKTKNRSIVHELNSHPFLGFFISIALATAGYLTGHAYHIALQIEHTTSMDYIVKVAQILAYLGGAAAGFVSFHGWYKKNYPKKSHKK
jgi:hypothetical protein